MLLVSPLHTSLSALHHPKWDPLQDLVCRHHFPLSKLACLGFQSAEGRNRKLWDCCCCALCAMQLSHWPAEERNRLEVGRSRRDLRGTSSAKWPQSGQMANEACTADNQHLWVQECSQTEPGNQLGWKWCNFTFSEISWYESDATSSPLKTQDGAEAQEFSLLQGSQRAECVAQLMYWPFFGLQ